MILIIDFGSQYNQLIARRVREHQVYCEIEPPGISVKNIKELAPEGIGHIRRSGKYLRQRRAAHGP